MLGFALSRTPALVALALATSIAGCGGEAASGPTPPIVTGPLRMGVLRGDSQRVAAGATRLPQPVVGRMVRRPDGTVSFRLEQAADRALDLLVPRAFAQGADTPVAGAVVCATVLDIYEALVPIVPCTKTGADGTASFAFAPPTRMGTTRAQLRGSVGNGPAVFDTAWAIVAAGAPSVVRMKSDRRFIPNPDGSSTLVPVGHDGTFQDPLDLPPGALDVRSRIDSVVDAYDNRIADAAPRFEWVFVPGLDPAPARWNAGPTATIPTGSGVYRLTVRAVGTQATGSAFVRLRAR